MKSLMKPRISSAKKIEFEEIYILWETIWKIEFLENFS